MNTTYRFKNVAVLGAAGKMGSGILYLNTLFISQLKLSPEWKDQTFVIHAIDQSHEQLNALIKYIRALMLKWAEKNIVWLRSAYAHRADLIENSEIIQAYVTETMDLIKTSTKIESAFESTLIFEAVLEQIDLKTKLFSTLKNNNTNSPWFLTNTSSIPIHELNSKANLNGNIIGCHFYNPPAIQKLIEIIELPDGNKELAKLVYGFGKSLGKIMVPANDIAGFIGNGFFMRDLLFALNKMEQLQTELTFAESVLMIDTITRDFMLRPMGIFQLMDYVGIDVCSFILNVMNSYLDEEMQSSLLIKLLNKNIKGGQNADGSQKTGIFNYEKGKIIGVYNLDNNKTLAIEPLQNKVNGLLGELPENQSWKNLSRALNKEAQLSAFFKAISTSNQRGCKMAVEYMSAMKSIGKQLVENKVTDSIDHVNTVMKTGFHHLYGPINDYCKTN